MQAKSQTFKIATRSSPLALWQANAVLDALRQQSPQHEYVLVPLTTTGDRFVDKSLAQLGGKGLFIKELEQALASGDADFAVHSAKDVPLRNADTWTFHSVFSRAQIADALVLPHHPTPMTAENAMAYLANLPPHSIIGTASVRRRSVLEALFPHLKVALVRGNLGTRLAKLDAEQDYQALILAASGLQRLDLAHRISASLPVSDFLPAIAQAALAVQFSAHRSDVAALLKPLIDSDVEVAVALERELGRYLVAHHAGCQMPLSVYAEHKEGVFDLKAQVFSVQGKRVYAQAQGSFDAVLNTVSQNLLAQGVRAILEDWEHKIL